MSTLSHADLVRRQYHIRTYLFMGGYTAVNLAAIFGAFDNVRPRGALALALVVSAPLAGQIWAMLAYMRASDEFVRGLMAKRFIVASGLAMALFSAWGFMETYAHVWHAPGWLVLVLFYLCYGVTAPFIRTSH